MPTGQYNIIELSSTSTVVVNSTSGTATFPAAAALSDNEANPTTVQIGASQMVWRNSGPGWYRVLASIDMVDGSNGTQFPGALGMAWNGASYDRLRTPNVFKPFSLAATSSALTVWTPTAGKKFRLMGFVLAPSSAGDVLLQDSTAPASASPVTIFRYPGGGTASAGGPPAPLPLGNGILSTSTNNLLTVTPPTTTATVSGTVWGTEE